MSERRRSWVGWLILLLLVAAGGAGVYALRTAEKPGPDPAVLAEAREEVGGASTLEEIMARQQGLSVARPHREYGDSDAETGLLTQLGTRGPASDPEVWEALRFGTAAVNVSAGGPVARVLVQDGGMWWQDFRAGPLRIYGGYALLGMIGLLVLFYLVRGKVRLSHGLAGVTIRRFNSVERFGHWLLAGSFLVLGATGLITLFGRVGLIPWLGKENYALLAGYSKLIHDNVAWAFILALILVFFAWVIHNLPARGDLNWVLRGGGIFGKDHPPARKFNAGQKVIFWSVILLGSSIAVSGLSLLFPFELPMFAKTFIILNDIGVPGWLGQDPLPTQLSPQEEMQYAQLCHAIVAFALMVIIIAHIYIGTVGMQGAAAAMVSGEVDLNWAKEHHSLWVEEVQAQEAKADGARASPAE